MSSVVSSRNGDRVSLLFDDANGDETSMASSYRQAPPRQCVKRTLCLTFAFVLGAAVLAAVCLVLQRIGVLSIASPGATIVPVSTSSPSAIPTAPPAPLSSFLHISDLHMDPYYNACFAASPSFCRSFSFVNDTRHNEPPAAFCASAFGQYGCDSPVDLVRAILEDVRTSETAVSVRASFAVVSGDFSAHRMWNVSVTYDAVRRASVALNETLGSLRIRVLPAIGNNDCFPNYCTANATWQSVQYAALFDLWSTELEWIAPSEKASFVRGGYYSADVTAGGHLRVIVLNSVLFSPLHSAYVPLSEADLEAQAQLQWLDRQLALAAAAGVRAYVVAHIAPASNDYMQQHLWHDAYQKAYANIVFNYTISSGGALVVAAHLFGHTHRDHFALLPFAGVDGAGLAFLMAPSVSPVSGTSPSWRRVLFDGNSSDLIDYEQYFTDFFDTRAGESSNTTAAAAPLWDIEYAFDGAYNASTLSYDALRRLYEQLRRDPTLFALWTARQLALASRGRVAALCAAGYTSYDEFQQCLVATR
jgi:hypothetical protein